MRPLYKLIIPLFLCFCFVFSQSLATDKTGKEISVKEAAALIKNESDNLLIVDVRTPEEYGEGHVPGAQNMDFFGSKFESQIQALPKDKSVLLYCRSGRRSAGAVQMLERGGFTKILHMHEGINGWEKAGMTLEKSQ